MKIKIYDATQKQNVFYRVEFGDTLEGIAKLFHVPTEYIVFHNGNNIYAGKLLFLPEINLQTYVVKPFDTLENIAYHHGKNVENLKQKNGLSSNYVFVGQKIYL